MMTASRAVGPTKAPTAVKSFASPAPIPPNAKRGKPRPKATSAPTIAGSTARPGRAAAMATAKSRAGTVITLGILRSRTSMTTAAPMSARKPTKWIRSQTSIAGKQSG